MQLSRFVLTSLLLIPACRADADAKLSDQDALAVVIDELVEDDRPLVYVHSEPIAAGADLRAYRPDALGGVDDPIEVETESWLVWIDDEPGALFSHANRFVLVDCETGETTVHDERWWPMLDGEALFVDPYEYDGMVHRDAAFDSDPAPLAEDVTCDGKPGKALVINGWEEGETLEESLDTGAQDMRALLAAAGFETTYHGPDGKDGVAGPATPQALSAWFDQAAKELEAGDTLVVYLAGHGTTVDGVVPRDNGYAGTVFETSLRSWLAKIDECVNVVVMIESCRSGSFVDGLQDSVNLLLTSTNKTKPAYNDIDRGSFFKSDTNPNDRGPEFTSSMNGILLDTLLMPAEIERIRMSAESNGQSFWEAAFADAFANSRQDDLAEQSGWSCPQSVHGNRGANKTPEVVAPACSENMPDDDDDTNPGDDDDDDDTTPPSNTCEALPDAAQTDLGRAAALIFGGTPDDAMAGVCTEGMPLPEGNETLHSDGTKVGIAVSEVDALWLGTSLTCGTFGGFSGCANQASAVPGLTTPTRTHELLNDLHCEFWQGEQLLLCPSGVRLRRGGDRDHGGDVRADSRDERGLPVSVRLRPRSRWQREQQLPRQCRVPGGLLRQHGCVVRRDARRQRHLAHGRHGRLRRRPRDGRQPGAHHHRRPRHQPCAAHLGGRPRTRLLPLHRVPPHGRLRSGERVVGRRDPGGERGPASVAALRRAHLLLSPRARSEWRRRARRRLRSWLRWSALR